MAVYSVSRFRVYDFRLPRAPGFARPPDFSHGANRLTMTRLGIRAFPPVAELSFLVGLIHPFKGAHFTQKQEVTQKQEAPRSLPWTACLLKEPDFPLFNAQMPGGCVNESRDC